MAKKRSKQTAWAIGALVLVVIIIVAVVLGVTLSNRGGSGSGSDSTNSSSTVGGSNEAVTDSKSPTVAPSDAASMNGTVCQAATKSDMEGPFYTANAPFYTNSDNLASDDEPGTRIKVEISLKTGNGDDCGTPLTDWIVDVWHASNEGFYDNAGFNLRGKYTTDEEGKILLKTVLPGFYQPRPRHVHFKIWNSGEESSVVLTSQFYMGDTEEELATLKGRYGEDRVVELDSQGYGSLDIVVE